MSAERARAVRAATATATATAGAGQAGPADIAAWQARLRAVVLDAVGEDEVREILGAIVAKAKGGDLAAARMILAYAVGSPPRDDRPDGPTRARPGSAAKIEALAYRQVRGVELHQPGDAGLGEGGEP